MFLLGEHYHFYIDRVRARFYWGWLLIIGGMLSLFGGKVFIGGDYHYLGARLLTTCFKTIVWDPFKGVDYFVCRKSCLKTHLWSSSRLPDPFMRQAKYMQWSRPRRCSSSWTVTWIWTPAKLLQIWYDLVPALLGAETSVPYYSLPAIVLPYASFLALWQRSSGNATKSPRNGGTGHTLICHDEVKVCHSLLGWFVSMYRRMQATMKQLTHL